MEYLRDPDKAVANKAKHGIGFADAVVYIAWRYNSLDFGKKGNQT